MNFQTILVVSGDHTTAPSIAQFRDVFKDSGLQFECIPSGNAVEYVEQKVQSGQDPVVILIDVDVAHPLTVARELRALWPGGHMIFISAGQNVNTLQRELQRAPKLGSHWSVAAMDGTSLIKTIGDAVRNTQRRMKLRTTLDRANAQLMAQKTVDSIEYRRLLLSERYLESFLSQVSDAIISLDAKAAVLYCNASAVRLFVSVEPAPSRH